MSDFGVSPAPGTIANGGQANGDAPQSGTPVPGWVEKEVLDYSTMEGRSSEGAFDGSARIYEWNDEYGDVGPSIPDLEKELFGNPEDGDSGEGLDFTKYASFPSFAHIS